MNTANVVTVNLSDIQGQSEQIASIQDAIRSHRKGTNKQALQRHNSFSALLVSCLTEEGLQRCLIDAEFQRSYDVSTQNVKAFQAFVSFHSFELNESGEKKYKGTRKQRNESFHNVVSILKENMTKTNKEKGVTSITGMNALIRRAIRPTTK